MDHLLSVLTNCDKWTMLPLMASAGLMWISYSELEKDFGYYATSE
jgi:hypothetical protein